jgi:hippurate hydrolase
LAIDDLLEHYRYLHENPELSKQEQNTAAYLARELEGMGYEITTGIGGHGLVGLLRNGNGPTIMYRADMDGLPVAEATGLPYASRATGLSLTGEEVQVMHACGHDVHMTVLLGVASHMAARRQNWEGTLVLVLQPAEELGTGARAMLDDGLFRRFPEPEAALALHVSASLPAGQVGYVSGFAMANVDEVDLTVFGRGGHGAYPHTTRDPVVLAAQIVLALQNVISRELSPLDSAVITVGSIHGGTKHNVISDEVMMQLTVRSYSDETRAYLLRRIEEISQGLARTARLPEDRLPVMNIRDEYTPAVYNSPALVDRALGLMPESIEVLEISPVMGGEDFSRYGRTTEQVPLFLFALGAVSKSDHAAAARGELDLPSLHSARFAPDAQPAISTGVDAMTAVLTGLLQPPK